MEYTNKFSLRTLRLIMQAPEHTFFRMGLVILHEPLGDPKLGKGFLVVGFQEEPTRVRKYPRLQQQNAFDFHRNDFHCCAALPERVTGTAADFNWNPKWNLLLDSALRRAEKLIRHPESCK